MLSRVQNDIEEDEEVISRIIIIVDKKFKIAIFCEFNNQPDEIVSSNSSDHDESSSTFLLDLSSF